MTNHTFYEDVIAKPNGKDTFNTFYSLTVDDDSLVKYFCEDERPGYLLINIRLKQLIFRWWGKGKTPGSKEKKEKVTVI